MVKKIIILLLFCDIAYASGAMVTPTDQSLITSDITTNDVSTSKHGFVPKAPGDSTKFLNGANPPAFAVPAGGGSVTTQSDVTASRALDGTVYQNTTGKTMFISINWSKGSIDNLIVYSDSANPPTTRVSQQTEFGVGSLISQFSVVLPGNYYRAVPNTGGLTLNSWIEWY